MDSPSDSTELCYRNEDNGVSAISRGLSAPLRRAPRIDLRSPYNKWPSDLHHISWAGLSSEWGEGGWGLSRVLSETACSVGARGNTPSCNSVEEIGKKNTAARLGGVNLLARDTPGRRIEVQTSVGATLRPTVLVGFSKLVGFRELRSRSTYRVFSLTAV